LHRGRSSVEGASGVETPKGVKCGEKVSPSHREGVLRGDPEIFFDILMSKWRIFEESLELNCVFVCDQTRPECIDCHRV